MPLSEVLKEMPNKYLNKEYLGKLESGYLKIMGEVKPTSSDLPIITEEKKLSNLYVYEYI